MSSANSKLVPRLLSLPIRRRAIALCVPVLIGACGGGGGGGSASTTASGSMPSSTLSASQTAYESAVLSQNGGEHYLEGNLLFTISGSGPVISPSSKFFVQNMSIPSSPAKGAQRFVVSLTSLADNLANPTLPAPRRWLVDGSVVVAASPQTATVTYEGPNIQVAYLAADGKTVVDSLLLTTVVSTPLSGLIGATPTQVFSGSFLGVLTDTINGQTLYSPQSAAVEVDDCVLPVTSGTAVTPCPSTSSQLSTFFPYTDNATGITYQFADGQVQTEAGVSMWVSTSNVPNLPTASRRIFYQAGGQIYGGLLMKAGTPYGISPLGGGAPQDFEIVFNQTAVQSIEAAIAF